MMDASILLPPTGTPLTGIDFVKRLPCGDMEKTRRVSRREGNKAKISHTLHRCLGVFLYAKACTVQLDLTGIPFYILYIYLSTGIEGQAM